MGLNGFRLFFIFLCISYLVVLFSGCSFFFKQEPTQSSQTKSVALKKHSPEYKLSLLYLVLYDDEKHLIDRIKKKIKTRLDTFKLIVQRESLGKIEINPYPVYFDVHRLGDPNLDYKHRHGFKWVDALLKIMSKKYTFDILVFTPIKKIPWSTDLHSIGLNVGGKIVLAMEYYSYGNKINDLEASRLMIHKMFHGFGYNHADIKYLHLSVLGWQQGLPFYTTMQDITNTSDHPLFLNPHVLSVLNLIEKPKHAQTCLDSNGLISIEDTKIKRHSIDAWNQTCLDVDEDGVRDSEDDYFLSSPKKGLDSDADGIVDSLDVCPDTHIIVTGNIKPGKINLVGLEEKTNITFQSKRLDIYQIKRVGIKWVSPRRKRKGVNAYFPKHQAITSANTVKIESKTRKFPFVKIPIEKIEVYYQYKGKRFYRSYYFYYPESPVYNIFNEREWYYFGRFGCDVPADIDLYDGVSYDANVDGFVDFGTYAFVKELPKNYDWDNDGFPDLKDTLPTVKGAFENQYVAGVKDSDGDGLGDPGYLDFSLRNMPRETFFGDIYRRIGKNPYYDRSPYFAGSQENKGCPDLDHDQISWYNDPDPFH